MPQFPEHLPRFQPSYRLARLHAPHGGLPGAGDGVLAAPRPGWRLAREAHRLLGLRRGRQAHGRGFRRRWGLAQKNAE